MRYGVALGLVVFGNAVAQTPATFTNMPVVCTEQKDLSGQPLSACKSSSQQFLRATDTSWVRHCKSTKCVPTGDPEVVELATWKRFDQVMDVDYVEVCTVARTPGAVVGGGSCPLPGGSTWSGMKYIQKPQVNKLPSLPPASFQVMPKEGVSPLHVTVSWNIPGMVGDTPCLAEGYPGWAGAKAASSKEEFDVTANAAFTLTCASLDTRHVLLTWKPPTLNTDGSVLTNLAYYTLHYGNTYVNLTPALSNTVQIDKSAEHYIVENLKPDRWMFGMRSVNAETAQSDLSNIVSYTTTASTTPPVPRFSGTEYVTVATQPEPPSGLEVVEAKAYSLQQSPDQLTVTEFGYVPVGTECDPKQAAMGLFLVKRDETTPNEGKQTPPVALAKCEYNKGEGKNLWQRDAPLP
jgi:hypothetical protein